MCKEIRPLTMEQQDFAADVTADVYGKVISIESARELASRLTTAQTRIASLIADGRSITQIGCICGMSVSDVKRELAIARDSLSAFAPEWAERFAA